MGLPRVEFPDSKLCKAATVYAEKVSAPFLFNHAMRSAVYAEFFGQQQGMKYDRELLYVSTILHDLGLTDVVPVKARFEIEGADAARAFLSAEGMNETALDLVWDAIALHTTAEIPQRKAPEVALCQLGIFADINLLPPGLADNAILDELLDDYPWLDNANGLMDSLIHLYGKNPAAANSNAVADACEKRVSGFKRFNFCEHLLAKSDRLASTAGDQLQ